MDGRRRDLVALGLLAAQMPRLRRHVKSVMVSFEAGLWASPEALEKALSLRPPEARDIFSRNFPDWADNEIRSAAKAGVAIVTFEEAGYPGRLRDLPDPPPSLYVRGRLEPDDGVAVAVVGSRAASPYGLRVAEALGAALAASGVTVVSGLARGIDTAAHRGAMGAGGRTVGVLGSGIDVIYPKENRKVVERIAAAGAVVTEFPFGAAPHAHHFPTRNRVIAALGEAVVVVEAARDSGSLITARLAADEMGMPVCAVPGPITSKTSEGCNDLIYDGAVPVRGVSDILGELPERSRLRAAQRATTPGGAASIGAVPGAITGAMAGAMRGLGRDARRVLDRLTPEAPISADELADSLGLASAVLLGHLLELEIKGLASQLPGGLFVRKY